MAEIRLYTGTARSGRASHLDTLLRSQWGECTLILPTRFAANRRLERILRESDRDAAWGRTVLAFEDFATLILRSEGHAVFAIQELERRLLVDGVVRELSSERRLDVLGNAAASPGFVKHVLHVITQLKQAAIDPASFRALLSGRKHASWLDEIVALVYEGYQATLLETGCYDRVGVYWRTEVAVREGRPKALEGLRTLLFDEFDDFTASEFRLIQALAAHVDAVGLGLPFNRSAGSQRDVYSIPHETADRIQRAFRVVEHREFAEQPPQTCAEYVATEIFWRDRPRPGPDLQRNVELVACPDLRQEVEVIGRRVKSLLLDRKVSAERIAVVFRTPADVAATVQSVFREFQIPVHLPAPAPIIESSPAAFLLGLFDVADGWARDVVLDVLISPAFPHATSSPEASLHRDSFRLLARRAGVIEGREEWRTRVEWLQARLDQNTGEDIAALKNQAPCAPDAARSLLRAVQSLAALLEQIPESGVPGAFISAMESILDQVKQSAIAAPDIAKDSLSSRLAEIEAIREALGRLEAWYGRGRNVPEYQRDDFLRLFRTALSDAARPPDVPPPAVHFLSPEALRHRDVDYVFLGGMNEGAFPRPPAFGAIYTEADVQDFKSLKVRFQDCAYYASQEMLLFRHVVASAKQALFVTWHERSPEGRPASRSPFLIDTLELLSDCGIDPLTCDAPAFAPRPDDVASVRDLRNAAFARSPGLRKLFPTECAPVLVAQRIEAARQDASRFGVYDGILADDAIQAALQHLYGVDHEYSVNQLETYAECPFRFFMERILGITAEEDPGTEFDPRIRGIILHEVLQRFHTSFRGKTPCDIPLAEAESVMSRHLEDVFKDRARWSMNTPRAMLDVEKTRLAERLNRYLRIDREATDNMWRPQYFEVSFGRAGKASSEMPSRSEPYVLDTPAGPILFSGRIDRIDRDDSAEARIIDYKSTLSVQQADLKAGVSLQMPLYAMAFQEHLMPGTRCAEARLVEVGSKKSLEGLKTRDMTFEERAALVREKIAAYVKGIRSGAFPPVPYKEQCRDCATHRPCRFDSGRVERKRSAEA
ncbi:MAG: PD-(D/E)XK nuclease family protein [Candidatus Hydrogenedentes bacterium]|nr:PD-(D/E)XK nuclease family protein [Candidatus Hydrogenedentota bacterium]